MVWRRRVAQASGATLGFIANNIPGAIKGWKAGGDLHDMRFRRRQRSRSVAAAPVKRLKTRGYASGIVRGGRSKLRRRRILKRRGHHVYRSGIMGGGVGFHSRNKGDDAGHSSSRTVRRPHPRLWKGLKKILAPQQLNSTVGTRFDLTNNGQQIIGMINLFYDAGYSPPTGGGLQKAYPFIYGANDINAMDLILSSTDPGGPAGWFPRHRFFVKYIKVAVTIRSTTNMPVELTLYDIVARRDQDGTSPALDGIWTAPLKYSPLDAWGAGMASDSTTTTNVSPSGRLIAQGPGVTPFESEEFVNFFRVKKVTKLNLHPGTPHVHHILLKPGKMVNSSLDIDDYYQRGLTTFLMAVVRGPVVHDSVARGNVNVGNAGVDFYATYRAEFTAVQKNRTLVSWSTENAAITIPEGELEDTDTGAALVVV